MYSLLYFYLLSPNLFPPSMPKNEFMSYTYLPIFDYDSTSLVPTIAKEQLTLPFLLFHHTQ